MKNNQNIFELFVHLVVILVLTFNIPSGISQNLILNPGCEDTLINGEIPHWTEVVDTNWTQRPTGNPPAYEGDYMFFPGVSPVTELQQDVDISTMATKIDSNNLAFMFEGYVRSYNQSNPDESRIILEYLDEIKTTKLDSFDSGNYSNTIEWVQITDTTIAPAGSRFVRVRLISTRHAGSNNDGYYDNLSLKPDIEVNITDHQPNIPETIRLHQNYPNPFNPSTRISFTIPKQEQVIVEVYNTIGQRIETLVNRKMMPGIYNVEFMSKNLPSGIYIYRIQAGKFQQAKKMVLIR